MTEIFATSVTTHPVIQELSKIIIPDLAYLAFAVYVLLLVSGGLVAVLARNLVRALIGLVVTFLGVAGMYLLLASPFMAFMQLLIYVGAICILIFFAIMLVKNNSTGEEMNMPSFSQMALAGLASLAVLAIFGPVIALNAGRFNIDGLPVATPLAAIGEGLLSYYMLPFELISVILLVGMAGGVFLTLDRRFRK